MAIRKAIYFEWKRGAERFSNPPPFGYDWFLSAIDVVWEAKKATVDWNDFEAIVRDIVESPRLTDEMRVRLIAEATGAYTGRGVPKVYKLNTSSTHSVETT